ncbi:hypothetical protein [Nocardioides sp.]|uniref:hypothetical protein n=1 Tax=Nocardioides sp. TaxID=35761 RepID=UPI00286BEFB3|nr:hypothetical protein [Nocardioides sp.]
MTDQAAATTRRTALGVALGGLVTVAGCDAVSDLSPRGDTSPSTAGASPTLPPADADAELVDRVVRDLETTLQAVPQGRGLQDRVADLRDMHAAHRAALTGGRDLSFATSGTPLPRAEALRRITRLERAHQRRLEAATLEARSGSLALLLAQMSAAVAQRLALLPTAREGGA